MPVFLHEVPGHVQLQDHVQNQVQVRAGNNWDLSRSAVATPIAQLKDPEPIAVETPVSPYEAAAAAGPVAVVSFRQNSSVVSAQGVKALASAKELTGKLYVNGYADAKESKPLALSLKRAEAVARRLRTKGVEVEVQAQGAEKPSSHGNRRVEVLHVPSKP